MVTSLGNVVIYRYDKTARTIVEDSQIIGDNSGIATYYIDQTNNLAIFSFLSGLIHCYDYVTLPLVKNDSKCAPLLNMYPTNEALITLDAIDTKVTF